MLVQRDLARIWHPCTQMSDHEWLPLLPITRAEGAYLYDDQGHRYIDAISSWWTCLLGHRHPAVVAAIKSQLDQLDHVLFAGCTHEPAVELAELLCAICGMDKMLFADNGSSAVEIALKLSFHYWQNHGHEKKHRFVCLANSYHGETLGALSVSDVWLYRKTYGAILLNPITAPSPDHYLAQADETAEQCADRAADALEQLLREQHQEIAALIVEPLVQCAGSMRMYHPQYLSRARALCTQYQVHFIADEIATGFGRTGTWFACEQAQIQPDFLLTGKGLTGGSLPLAAVLTTQNIYDAFYADYQSLRAFLHSHSYTANPLACAAAVATIKAMRSQDQLRANQITIAAMRDALAPIAAHPNVGDVRQTGMIAAIELVANKASREPFDWRERRGLKVYQHGLTQGALLRPLGNVVYLMPPYCITPDQIQQLATTIAEGIDIATR
jgi:adenosylmethionine---8-amino-7-oxononanoate aminotransferase